MALLMQVCLAAQTGRILVVAASSGDYILAAGGTLAQYVRDGWRVDVAQWGNDEKVSTGLSPAQTRIANIEEGRAAAKLLGVTDLVHMSFKSGELGYISSTEMRQQLFALIRHMRPRIIFIPDPYVHYMADRDHYYTAKMAEEAWGYSGASTFGDELIRMGLKAYGAPEIFYYAPRPYRKREGGDGRADFAVRDITATMEIKLGALDLLDTRNRAAATEASIRLGRPIGADSAAVLAFGRAYATELAETIGAKHGHRYGEEFNHVGPRPGLPEHVLEHARPRR